MDKLRVFISYSWDTPEHTAWVEQLATRLSGSGYEVLLDRWALKGGADLTAFMERAVRTSGRVVLVCTPGYKKRADDRVGGGGYETALITGEILLRNDRSKFIPILRSGTWAESAPSYLTSGVYVDLAGNPYPDHKFAELILALGDCKGAAEVPGPTAVPASSRAETVKADVPKPSSLWQKAGTDETVPNGPPAIGKIQSRTVDSSVCPRFLPQAAKPHVSKAALAMSVIVALAIYAVPRAVDNIAFPGPDSLVSVRVYNTKLGIVVGAAAVILGGLAVLRRFVRALRGQWSMRAFLLALLSLWAAGIGELNLQALQATPGLDLRIPKLSWPFNAAVAFLLSASLCILWCLVFESAEGEPS